MEEKLKPIHISDMEALEKEIIDDMTARRLALLRQTVDTCYRKKLIDKACEWLCLHMPFGEVDKELRDSIIDEFESFMKK